MLQYYTCMQYTVIQKIHTYIHKNESMHSEMGPVWQNPIQRPARSVHMCVHHTVHNVAQNRPDDFPSYPSDNHHCSNDVYLREGGAGKSVNSATMTPNNLQKLLFTDLPQLPSGPWKISLQSNAIKSFCVLSYRNKWAGPCIAGYLCRFLEWYCNHRHAANVRASLNMEAAKSYESNLQY